MTHPSKAERVARWLVPLALILFAGAAIYISTTFKTMPPILKRGIQPSDFPQVISGLIIFLSLLMAWRDPIRITEKITRQTWATFAALAGFVILFSVDMFLALGVFAGALSILWGERRAHLIALVGAGVPLAVFLLFEFAFRIRFPRGVLTNLWYG